MIRSVRDDFVRIKPTSPRRAGHARRAMEQLAGAMRSGPEFIVPDCPVVLFVPEMLNGRRSDTVSSKEGSLLVKFVAIDRLAAQQCMQCVIDVDCRAAGQAKMKNLLRAAQLARNDCVHFGDRC